MKRKIDANLIYDLVFGALVFFIPLSMAIPNICLVLLGILFIYNRFEFSFKQDFKKLFLALTILLIVKSLFTMTALEDLNENKHLITAVFLFVFAEKIKNLSLVLISYLLGLSLTVFVSIIQLAMVFFEHNELSLGNSIEASQLLLVHRPYFGFMCVIAVLILLSQKKLLGKLQIPLIVFFSLFVYIISSRLAIGLLFFIFLTILIKTLRHNPKKLLLGSVLILSIFIGLLVVNQGLKDRFKINSSYKKTIELAMDYEPRIVIWSCSYDLIFEDATAFFIGFKGFENIQKKLTECYASSIRKVSKRDYYVKEAFNSHNQFIDFQLKGGIFAMLLFISVFLSLIGSRQLHSSYFLALVLCFLFFAIFENYLARQWGSYLFGCLVPIFYRLFVNNQDLKSIKDV